MAQELGDELGRLLRERGPIDTALEKFERQTRVRREYLAYGAMGVVAIMFAMDMMGAFLCQTISALVGVLGSLRALERQDPVALQKWTSYWLIYIILNVYFDWLVRLIGHYFIKIYMFKFLLLAWCALPIESNGSDYIYNKLLAHRLFRSQGAGTSVAKKTASPPLQPPSGDERRDKVRASGSPDRRSGVVA
ncbi:receptor expression-enhancing protein 6-like [Dermacentor albipictus]|uniref:receptor expression-enhancing protein 6-like n=1 Tax=Dermacentor albipictus TaxID=60249 RepID=UPI0031FC979F